MRVISGTAKGRKLVAPAGKQTRPTAGRVREALFSIISGDIAGAQVLDLFAGSGALGIEALSRGAAHTTFVEYNSQALIALRRNIQCVANGATILAMSATHALTHLQALGRRYDIVFLDPPYASQLLTTTLITIAAGGLLSAPAVVVCEHAGRVAPPSTPAGWQLRRHRIFGDVALSLFDVEGLPP